MNECVSECEGVSGSEGGSVSEGGSEGVSVSEGVGGSGSVCVGGSEGGNDVPFLCFFFLGGVFFYLRIPIFFTPPIIGLIG